jgi:6-phosphogluconolactonase
MQPITVLKAVSAILPILLCLSLFAVEGTAAPVEDNARAQCLVYVGTYTGPKSTGIYVCRMNLATGKLTSAEPAAETPSPSFLAIDPKHRFLYAANEVDRFDGKPAGAVTAFSIDARTGKLTQLNQRSSMGSGPCHLILDQKAGTAAHGGALV